MELKEFYYDLPEELIAQVPIKNRDESRLMVLNRKSQTKEHKIFKDIINYLEPGDCLVRNNTKVIPARLYGIKEETGANIEFLLLNRIDGDIWEVMVRPGRRLIPGVKVTFGDGILKAEILEKMENGNRKVKFEYNGIFNEILDKIGLMPLPPYIHEKLKEKDRYQTVYAKNVGSAAAPTAGLHFTEELLEEIKKKGVTLVYVTLHVGLGTFRPVEVSDITKHHMHSEYYVLSKEAADTLNNAKGKIYAVGTTSTRVLETVRHNNEKFVPCSGNTDIFIYPGFEFKAIDGLITNFHLPKSTLLMLVSALSSKENILNAYNYAIKHNFRFFSFVDAMFIK